MGRKIGYELGNPDERNVTPLTLKLRIALEPLDTGGDGKIAIVKARGLEFKCVHFPPAEFDIFKVRFRREVPFMWSGKIFILLPEQGYDFSLPPADYKRFVYAGPSRFSPVIECRLAIEFDAVDPHYRITVLKRAPGQPRFPSFTFPEKKAGRPDGVLDSTDLDMRMLTHTVKDKGKAVDKDFVRFTAAHEVGHLLGLEHVNKSNAVCKLDDNDEICYGDTIWQSDDMMGAGRDIRAWHGRPWLYVIKKVMKHDRGWRLTTDPAADGGAPPLSLVDRLGAAVRSGARELWQEVSAAF